jgi:hypothetical protein
MTLPASTTLERVPILLVLPLAAPAAMLRHSTFEGELT